MLRTPPLSTFPARDETGRTDWTMQSLTCEYVQPGRKSQSSAAAPADVRRRVGRAAHPTVVAPLALRAEDVLARRREVDGLLAPVPVSAQLVARRRRGDHDHVVEVEGRGIEAVEVEVEAAVPCGADEQDVLLDHRLDRVLQALGIGDLLGAVAVVDDLRIVLHGEREARDQVRRRGRTDEGAADQRDLEHADGHDLAARIDTDDVLRCRGSGAGADEGRHGRAVPFDDPSRTARRPR